MSFLGLVAGASLVSAAIAQTDAEGNVPDEALLEFLGAWADGDEDWVTIAIELAGLDDSGKEVVGKEPVETDDEDE